MVNSVDIPIADCDNPFPQIALFAVLSILKNASFVPLSQTYDCNIEGWEEFP
jgi:hypothetical protein